MTAEQIWKLNTTALFGEIEESRKMVLSTSFEE